MGAYTNSAETINEFDFLTGVSWNLDLAGRPLEGGDSLIIYENALRNSADITNNEEVWDYEDPPGDWS